MRLPSATTPTLVLPSENGISQNHPTRIMTMTMLPASRPARRGTPR
jgi:hypothetical protein